MTTAALDWSAQDEWGALHVIVSDGNCEDHCIEFCEKHRGITAAEREFLEKLKLMTVEERERSWYEWQGFDYDA